MREMHISLQLTLTRHVTAKKSHDVTGHVTGGSPRNGSRHGECPHVADRITEGVATKFRMEFLSRSSGKSPPSLGPKFIARLRKTNALLDFVFTYVTYLRYRLLLRSRSGSILILPNARQYVWHKPTSRFSNNAGTRKDYTCFDESHFWDRCAYIEAQFCFFCQRDVIATLSARPPLRVMLPSRCRVVASIGGASLPSEGEHTSRIDSQQCEVFIGSSYFSRQTLAVLSFISLPLHMWETGSRA